MTKNLFSSDTKSFERHVPDLVLVVDDDGNAREEVRPVSRSWIVESEIHRSVRGENGEGEDEVIVGANDAELVHGSVVRCNLCFDDFFGSFLQIVEGVCVKIVVGPACNNETDVLGGVVRNG